MTGPWKARALTEDLAERMRADLFLVAIEATLDRKTGQRADLLAMQRTLADAPFIIFEVKVNRGDLLGDLRRGKWRGYLNAGAVVFAFPRGLGQVEEIPPEAGVIIRHDGGWRWARGAPLRAAPRPTPYLYRRMALTATDQAQARATSRQASLWTLDVRARTDLGRRLARMAQDLDGWEQQALYAQAEIERLRAVAEGLRKQVPTQDRLL